MKGLLLFVAGLLCGGAAVSWLFLSREQAAPVAVEWTLPVPAESAAGVTGLEPGADDLPLTKPSRDPHDAPGLDIDPLARTTLPPTGVGPLPGTRADDADGAADGGDETTGGADTTTDPADADGGTDLIGDGRVVDDASPTDKPADKAAADTTDATVPPAAKSGTAPQATAPPDPEVLAALRAATLLMPVQGIEPGELLDTYSDARGEGRSHDAIDIMAPTGRPVRAVADGRIAKLFASVPGGLTIYQFDADERLAYYYAHLDRYADGLEQGATVKRGDVIGYVGATGNANKDAPHLHFAIFVLGPEKRWWQGTPVNPYPVLRRADTELAGGP